MTQPHTPPPEANGVAAVSQTRVEHPLDRGLHRAAEARQPCRRDHLVMAGGYDRIEAGTTWVVWDGPPHLDPTSGRPGSFIEEALSLNEVQLLELCSYWEWRSDQATRDSDRWWCWTVVRFARQILAVRRGHHPRPRQPS